MHNKTGKPVNILKKIVTVYFSESGKPVWDYAYNNI
jgi:hypothetical protein